METTIIRNKRELQQRAGDTGQQGRNVPVLTNLSSASSTSFTEGLEQGTKANWDSRRGTGMYLVLPHEGEGSVVIFHGL